MTEFNTPGFVEGMIDQDESLDIRRKRLKFRSWHRGIKEADILLGSFADKFLEKLTHCQLDSYENLLREADSDLIAWITKNRSVPSEFKHDVMELLQSSNYIKIIK